MLDYIGIIATISIALYAYKAYKNGRFSKDYKKVLEQKQSKFQKCWKNSRIYEVYVINSKQRPNINVLLWIGVIFSAFSLFVFIIFVFEGIKNPIQPFDKLIKYEVIAKKIYYYKKSNDILDALMNNGRIKKFSIGLKPKDWNIIKNKKITIWIQKKISILQDGNYDDIQLIKFNNNVIGYDANYIEKYTRIKSLEKRYISYLILSIKWLFGFLTLLWIINRKPATIRNK